MNIKKSVDYSTMYQALTAILEQNLPQMHEVFAIGKAVSQRPEKGAAVAASEFLQASFPDRTGFSPRNLRRMRDFYRTYENDQDILQLALKIGWTLNVVIIESELTSAERRWYLEQAQQFRWSKTQLLNALQNMDPTENTEDIDPAKQKINQTAVENPVFIIEIMRNIHSDSNLSDKVLGKQQKDKLRRSPLFGIHSKCRLNIDFAVSIVDHGEILHDMAAIILPAIQACILKSNIRKIILCGIIEIGFTFDIIALCYGNQKRVIRNMWGAVIEVLICFTSNLRHMRRCFSVYGAFSKFRIYYKDTWRYRSHVAICGSLW